MSDKIHYAPASWTHTACAIKVTGSSAPAVSSNWLAVTCARCLAAN